MKIDMTGVYLVHEEILPKAIKKTILAKELINRGEVRTVNEAVVKANLSRSAYYKYKDYVYSFFEATRDKIVTLALLISHRSGNVMTINQGIPARGAATVHISLETAKLYNDFQTLLERVDAVDGVQKLEVIGQA